MKSLPNTPQINTLLADLRQELEIIYGSRLKELILFGSWARNDASTESDIDVLVILDNVVNAEDEIERTGDVTADLSLTYNVVISCVFIPENRFVNEKSPFVLNVQKEGVPV